MGDEQVPPLEDVPEVLEKIERAEDWKKIDKPSDSHNTCKKIKPDTENDGSLVERERKTPCDEKTKTQQQQQKRESTGFGGMKKGFLFGGQSKVKKTSVKKKEDIPVPLIQARPEKSSLVIKEVQEAMDANNAMEFQDQLAKRLEANPRVADVIADPAWIPILDELQRDPQATLQKYRHDPAIITTLKELCSVLGDTFLHLSNKAKSDDVESYAESPAVCEALADPLIKKIMEHMKEGDNVEVQRCVQYANPSQKRRIQTLIDVGMFRFSI